MVDLMQISKNVLGSVNNLTSAEIAQLEAWVPEERDALLGWIRWSRGRKFTGGIKNKMAAKVGFLAAWNLVMAVHGLKKPTEENKLVIDEALEK